MATTEYTITSDLAAAAAWINDGKITRATIAGNAILFQQWGYLRHQQDTFYIGPSVNIAIEGDTLTYDDTHPVNTIYYAVAQNQTKGFP